VNERNVLIIIHATLFLLQVVSVGLAIGIDAKFAGLSVPISAAQAFFPNPFKK